MPLNLGPLRALCCPTTNSPNQTQECLIQPLENVVAVAAVVVATFPQLAVGVVLVAWQQLLVVVVATLVPAVAAVEEPLVEQLPPLPFVAAMPLVAAVAVIAVVPAADVVPIAAVVAVAAATVRRRLVPAVPVVPDHDRTKQMEIVSAFPLRNANTKQQVTNTTHTCCCCCNCC